MTHTTAKVRVRAYCSCIYLIVVNEMNVFCNISEIA